MSGKPPPGATTTPARCWPGWWTTSSRTEDAAQPAPRALRHRAVAPAESEKTAELNLYLRQFRDTQISLFNLLTRHLPTVSLTAPLANELLARFVGGHDEVTLLDIGIGSGHQEVAMLRLLAKQGRLPRRLNVIAIEPDAGSLIESQSALFEATAEAGVELEFVPHPQGGGRPDRRRVGRHRLVRPARWW